jgi:hypothetical protein
VARRKDTRRRKSCIGVSGSPLGWATSRLGQNQISGKYYAERRDEE